MRRMGLQGGALPQPTAQSDPPTLSPTTPPSLTPGPSTSALSHSRQATTFLLHGHHVDCSLQLLEPVPCGNTKFDVAPQSMC